MIYIIIAFTIGMILGAWLSRSYVARRARYWDKRISDLEKLINRCGVKEL